MNAQTLKNLDKLTIGMFVADPAYFGEDHERGAADPEPKAEKGPRPAGFPPSWKW